MDISFEYYKIFYYVAKYENITKAAMVLKSSQPNVTRIIHILEDQLDCRLFLREPRGLKLTEEGKRLYAHVAIACQHLLDAEAELCRDKNVCSGTIELGVTETALHLFLLQNLHDFQTGYPEIKIRIQNNTTPEILKSLQNGRLDLAVVTTPFELHDALACEDLLTFREVPAGGPDYAALSDRPMTLKEFRLHSIIGLGYGTASYEYYRKVFIEQHLDYEPAMEVATADLVIPLLQNNLGVGFVPEPLAAPFFENDSLVPLTLNVPLPSREVKMLWDKSRSQSRATATFCSYLRERCQRNLFIVITSNLLTADFDPLTLLAALVCVTSLIFATNDIVLIVLWTLASLENPAYIPVVVNFTIFFFNDMYGFISWRRREILMDL